MNDPAALTLPLVFVCCLLVIFSMIHVDSESNIIQTQLKQQNAKYNLLISAQAEKIDEYNKINIQLGEALLIQNSAIEVIIDIMSTDYDFTTPRDKKDLTIPNYDHFTPDWFTPNHSSLIDAIGITESNANPNAIGDNGDSLGMYQIQYAYWLDAIENNPSIGGSYEDVYDPEYAKKIVISYFDRYGKAYIYDIEALAKIHNGGPLGPEKNATIEYWNKVKQYVR